MGLGLTTGSVITAGLRFYLSPGSNIVAYDNELRDRAYHLLSEECESAWTRYPWPFRFADGTVSITATTGYGTLPTDFGNMGSQGQVYLSIAGQTTSLPPMTAIPISILQSWLQLNPTLSVSYPTHYAIHNLTTDGIPQIYVWPPNSGAITLLVKSYERRVPELFDSPVAPAAADSGTAGNPSGTYLYRTSVYHSGGETEGGPYSTTAITVSSKKIQLTGIPLSQTENITGRRIYRTAASGTSFLLVASLADNVTTSYLDNIADGSLGTAAVTMAAAVTGMEQYPPDFHRHVFVRALMNRLMGSQGDQREIAWGQNWEGRLARMWANCKPNQNQGQVMPEYGRGIGMGGRTIRQRMPR